MTEFQHPPVQLFGRTTVSGTAVIGIVVDETTGAIKVKEVAPSGTITSENVDIVAQSYKPLIVQLNSGTNLAGTLTASQDTHTSFRTEALLAAGTNLAGTLTASQDTHTSFRTEALLAAGTNLAGTITARGETTDLQQSTPQDDEVFINALQTSAAMSAYRGIPVNGGGCWDSVRTLDAALGGTIGTLGVVAVGGTLTSIPSGTQDINVVGDTANLMKSTGGTVTFIGASATSAIQTRVLVSTSSTQLLAADSDRVSVIIVNGSGNDVFIGLGATASTLGIPLFNQGDSYELSMTNNYNGAVSAIAAVANSTLYISKF